VTDRPIPNPEPTPGRFDWADTRLDGHPIRFWILVALVITSVVIGFGAWWTTRTESPPPQAASEGMGGMTVTGETPFPPPVTAVLMMEQDSTMSSSRPVGTDWSWSSLGVIDRPGRVDQTDMAERLGEVPDQVTGFQIHFLRQQT